MLCHFCAVAWSVRSMRRDASTNFDRLPPPTRPDKLKIYYSNAVMAVLLSITSL